MLYIYTLIHLWMGVSTAIVVPPSITSYGNFQSDNLPYRKLGVCTGSWLLTHAAPTQAPTTSIMNHNRL